MDFLIATTTATSTTFKMTSQALELLNFYSQLFTFAFCIIAGLMITNFVYKVMIS